METIKDAPIGRASARLLWLSEKETCKMRKILKIALIIAVLLVVGMIAVVMFQMYKPVLDASKEIDEVDDYALSVTDKLVDRDVKVIGFGEATHGNKEFQELKLDVLKTLVRDNGVSAICFEMDYAEGLLVNEYISGKSDMSIEDVFSHISFDIYRTEEIKELLEWMKAYNADSRDGYLEFYGFDIQNPEVDVYVIDEFVKRNHIPLESESISAYLAGEFRFKDARMENVFYSLETYRETLSDNQYRNLAGIDKVLKCFDNILLSKELAAISSGNSIAYGTYRDKAMKDNIIGISDSVGYPIMITGHNGHVGYAGSYVKTMGAYLKEALGDDYFVIGTDYFKTSTSLSTEKGRKNYTYYSADPLSYQAKRLGTYYLRFDDLKDNEKLNSIVTGKMPTGSLGEGFKPLNKFLPGTIRLYAPPADLYDGMIFVYEASPFTILNDGM